MMPLHRETLREGPNNGCVEDYEWLQICTNIYLSWMKVLDPVTSNLSWLSGVKTTTLYGPVLLPLFKSTKR